MTNQSLYTKRFLEELNLADLPHHDTPMVSNWTPDMAVPQACTDLAAKFPYRRIIGKVIHLVNHTRPDIARDRNNCCKVYEGLIDPMQASRKLPGSFHCELDIIRYCIARTRRGAPVRL